MMMDALVVVVAMMLFSALGLALSLDPKWMFVFVPVSMLAGIFAGIR